MTRSPSITQSHFTRDPSARFREHAILDLRQRSEDVASNYMECACGWREDGPGSSEAFAEHRRLVASLPRTRSR